MGKTASALIPKNALNFVVLGILSTAVLLGCEGMQGDPGTSALFEAETVEPGENCSAGGLAISSGLDLDDSGTLDASEITATRFVCNGADGTSGTDGTDGQDGDPGEEGKNVLIESETLLPDDPDCPTGGIEVTWGLDLDDSGTLEVGEVTGTEQVCNGAKGDTGEIGETGLQGEPGIQGEPGQDGTDGAEMVIRTDPLAPDPEVCPAGGIAVSWWLDANDNGIADGYEVVSTSNVCNGRDGLPGIPGTDGLPGEDGKNALLRTVTLAPGDDINCENGGIKLLYGLDANDNGVLEDDEAEPAEYLCQPVNADVCRSGCRFNKLGDAIASATMFDNYFVVASGVYTEPGITMGGDYDVTFRGAGPDKTFIQAASSREEAVNRVFTIPAGKKLTLQQMTIRYGQTPAGENGGGIHNLGQLILNKVVVTENGTADGTTGEYEYEPTPGDGGGIWNGGSLSLYDCTISNNRTGNGGAEFMWDENIQGGDGGVGAGIVNDHATMIMVTSTVSGNTCGNGGHGCVCEDFGYGLECTSGAGSGGEGAGMRNETSTVTIFNSTVTGNAPGGSGSTCGVPDTSFGDGGGILSARSTTNILFSTISGNTAYGAYGGGGIALFFGSTTLKGTVIAGNTSTNGNHDCISFGDLGTTPVNSLGYLAMGTTTGCTIGGIAPMIVGATAGLGALADNGGPTLTMAPAVGSPLIDAIPPADCNAPVVGTVTADQRGMARPQGANCDIGSVEVM